MLRKNEMVAEVKETILNELYYGENQIVSGGVDEFTLNQFAYETAKRIIERIEQLKGDNQRRS